MNAMYNLLQECSEEKGWQKPTIETIQGNFRTLEYIAGLENKLDYYTRLADAAGEYISELELSDTCPLICDEDHCQECNQKHDKYNSILKEREGKK
jgi:hypothetical protein